MKRKVNSKRGTLPENSWAEDPRDVDEHWAIRTSSLFANIGLFFIGVAFFMPTYFVVIDWFKMLGMDIDNLGIQYMSNSSVGYNWQCLPNQPVSVWLTVGVEVVVLTIVIVMPIMAVADMSGFESMKASKRNGFVCVSVIVWLLDLVVYFGFVKSPIVEPVPYWVTAWLYLGVVVQFVIKGFVFLKLTTLDMKPENALALALLVLCAFCTVFSDISNSPKCSPYVKNSRTLPAVVITPTPINLHRR